MLLLCSAGTALLLYSAGTALLRHSFTMMNERAQIIMRVHPLSGEADRAVVTDALQRPRGRR